MPARLRESGRPRAPNPALCAALGKPAGRCILVFRQGLKRAVDMRNLDDDPPVITLSAGPVDAYPVVLRALSRPVTYDFDPSFQQFYESTVLKTADALRTDRPPVILQGEPVLGLEAAAAALVRADDVVLNLASGEYGKGFGFWAARHCRELVEIEVPYDDAVDPESVREMLTARPDIRILSVCHHDTPSGTINPVREIGTICRAHDVLTIVDAVSSFGGMDVHPEEVHADIFVTGPNKCLGGSTGLCIVHVSERAWARIDANPDAPSGSVLSLKDWRDAWRADVLFPFTPSVSEVHALDAAVQNYLGRGSGSRVGAPRADGTRLPRRRPCPWASTSGPCAKGFAPIPRRRCGFPTVWKMRRSARRRANATAWSSPPVAARCSASWCESAIWGRSPGRSTLPSPSPRSAAPSRRWAGGSMSGQGSRRRSP